MKLIIEDRNLSILILVICLACVDGVDYCVKKGGQALQNLKIKQGFHKASLPTQTSLFYLRRPLAAVREVCFSADWVNFPILQKMLRQTHSPIRKAR